MTAFQPFGEKSIAAWGNCPPALLTSTSIVPNAFPNGIEQPRDGVRIADRHRMGEHFGAELGERTRDRVEPRGIASAQSKLGAEPGELKRDRLADAAPGAGDQHDLTRKQAVTESERHRGKFFIRFAEFLGHALFASFEDSRVCRAAVSRIRHRLRHWNWMIHQHLGERFALRVDTERRDAAAAERIVQEEIERMNARQIEALNSADPGMSEPIADHVFRKRRS